MITSRRDSSYYIAMDALVLTENAMDNPQRVSASIVENCTVSLYVPGTIDFTAEGWYRRWFLDAYSTKLSQANVDYNVYARLQREGNRGLIVFSTNEYDLTETSDVYFWLKIGTAKLQNGKRVISLDLGCLDTPLGRSNNFLRKDIEDTAHRKITFESGLDSLGDSVFGRIQVPQLDASGNPIVVDGVPSTVEYNGAVITEDGTMKSGTFSEGVLGSGYKLGRYGTSMDSYLEIDRLLVRKIAYFVELMIEKLSHVGGQIILTAASMVCSRVEEKADAYRCYFAQDDGDKSITNDFVVGDLARCQSFNIKAGTSHNVSNSYYWRKVTAVGTDWIDLSKTDCDTGSTTPEIGDNIVLLGHKRQDDESEADAKARQKAIILSSYDNGAPYIAKYTDISSYSLAGCEVSFDGFVDGEQTLHQYGSFFFGDKGDNPKNYIQFIRSGVNAGLSIRAKKIIFETTKSDGTKEDMDVEQILSAAKKFQQDLIDQLSDMDKASENFAAIRIIYESLANIGEWDDAKKQYSDTTAKKVKGYLYSSPDESFLGNAGVVLEHDLIDDTEGDVESNWKKVDGVYTYHIKQLTGSGFVSTDNFATMFSQLEYIDDAGNKHKVKADITTSVQWETDDKGNKFIKSGIKLKADELDFSGGTITLTAKEINLNADAVMINNTPLDDIISTSGFKGGATGTIVCADNTVLSWRNGVLVGIG